jgi:hypothetical protein
MKKITILTSLLAIGFNQAQAANKLEYLTGLYAKTTSNSYVLDQDFLLGTRNEFIDHILTYKPQALITQENVTENYQEGKRVFKKITNVSGISGYAYFAGESAIDILSKTQSYSSGIVRSGDSSRVLIHEDGHLDGLGHEDCNYRWVKFQGIWRRTQEYDYGNLLACGIMAYGSTSFTPVDDWDFRRVSGQVVQKARVRGTITINNLPLKGANLIFISQTKTFKPTWRVLNQRFSTIVDILGDGDGSFEIELPPDNYRVMLVSIGDYDRDTHGKWRLEDSQIKDITEPLFLNGKRIKFTANPSTEGILTLTNGQDTSFNWRIE